VIDGFFTNLQMMQHKKLKITGDTIQVSHGINLILQGWSMEEKIFWQVLAAK